MNKTTQDMSTTEKRKEIVASLREGFAALPLDIEVWLDEQDSNPNKQ